MKKFVAFSKIAVLTVLIVCISGCEKDNINLLEDGTWNFEDFSTESDNSDIQSLVALGKAVLTDGTLVFSSDDSYVMDSPVIDTETGTWELVGTSQLIFTNSNGTRTATIEEISKKELIYLETYMFLDTETYTVKYTWVK
ncbi:MAG: lipocalin family protein [Bacteroidales bacterium]|nr:lipocalin family protein [Bacteroidales bacterium]